MAKVAYIDVDDTLVRSAGTKRILVLSTVARVKSLKEESWQLYCWSSGDYARRSAVELGIESCFIGFLPKPDLMIDDVPPQEWRYLTIVHPAALIWRRSRTTRPALRGQPSVLRISIVLRVANLKRQR